MGRPHGRGRGSAAVGVAAGILAIAVVEAAVAIGFAWAIGPPRPATPAPLGAPSASGPAALVPTPDPALAVGRGKGVALRHGHHAWGANPAALESDLADVERVGADWIRVRRDYSPGPDLDFDRLVHEAQARGIRLLVTLGKPEPVDDLGTPEDRALYRRWVAAIVVRYRAWVHHWEILNEPNLHIDWSIDEATTDEAAYRAAVVRYLTLLRDAHEAIVAADPRAVVHVGGISEWTMERFLRVMMTTDAHRYFDVLDVHPYGHDAARVVARYEAARSLLAQDPDYAPIPLWVTEVGFNTTWPRLPGYVSSEGEKAAQLTAAIDGLRAAGMTLPIFWYTLHENDDSPGFGLLVKDPMTLATSYLPAFGAYQRVDGATAGVR